MVEQGENGSSKGLPGEKIAEDLHSLFLESMEARYKEILSFFGFIIPSLTGFWWIANQYEISEPYNKPVLTFFLGTASIVFILLWGVAYAFAISYRYRYLQACVYKIEETVGADFYIPASFQPQPIITLKSKLCMSFAPGILQTHIFFFIVCIIGVCIGYCLVSLWTWHSYIIVYITVLSLIYIFYLGSWHFPQKLNHLISNLNTRQHSN